MEGAKIKEYNTVFHSTSVYRVLFYNADLLKQCSVKVPTTLDELKKQLKQFTKNLTTKLLVFWFRLINNYYAIGMKNKGIDFTKN